MPNQSKIDNFLLLFVVGVLTLASFSAVYFSYKTYVSDPSESQNDNLLVLQGKSNSQGVVLSGCLFCPGFTLKDKDSNQIITSATVRLTSPSGFDACGPQQGPLETDPNKWFFGYWANSQKFVINCTEGPPSPSTYTVSISKSGYTSSQPTINNSGSNTVFIEKTSSDSSASSDSSSSVPTSDSSSNTGTTTTVVEKETLNGVTLPKTFTAKKATTTNLSKITDLTKVKNFTLDVPGKNKIVFKETLDLSSDKLVAKFKELGKYVKIGEGGKVTVDSKGLAALNKKATVTMYKLTHLFEPEILIDGKKDTKKVVSNVTYDKKTGTLTFDVAHFSTLTAPQR